MSLSKSFQPTKSITQLSTIRLHHYIPLLLTGAASLTAAAPAPANDLTKRDGSDVVAAVNQVASQTKTLNETVSSYDGGIVNTLTVIEIETEAIALNNDLRSAICVTEESGNFTEAESLDVAARQQGMPISCC